ncbi:hypothetical protein [Draconibacterium sp.]|uniref:hypothetical protein n=1 Tax=Draconibacterium sp. TaxID=1965318 RepID=UPI003569C219
MKRIKNLTVKTTFSVGLGDLEVPDKVFEQLKETAEIGEIVDPVSFDYTESAEWLRDNIHLRDCMECEWEITELDDES